MKLVDDGNNPRKLVAVYDSEEEKADFIKGIQEMRKMFCTCEEQKQNESNTRYVENYKGVHHGWVCNYCDKFTTIG